MTTPNQNEITGPDRRHDQYENSLYFDGYPRVPLEIFEEHLLRLANARTALEAALDARMRGWDLPHSPAIDQLISAMPVQDQIAIIDRNLGLSTKYENMVANHRAALEACSDALAAADHAVGRFLTQPSFTDPANIDAVALGMEQAFSQLEAAYAR